MHRFLPQGGTAQCQQRPSKPDFCWRWAWACESMSEHPASQATQDLPRRPISLLPHPEYRLMSCRSAVSEQLGQGLGAECIKGTQNLLIKSGTLSLGGPPTSHWELLSYRSTLPMAARMSFYRGPGNTCRKSIQICGPGRNHTWESKGKAVSTQPGTMQDGEKAYKFENSARRRSKKSEVGISTEGLRKPRNL